MTPLRTGSVFADAYEIVRPISQGGMGIVYEVIHVQTKRHRALKVMLAHIVSDPVMRERFSLEAVVSADIESEHITEIFDAGIDRETDCPYLVMELLHGEDLAARLKRNQRFDKDETLELMAQAARALAKTHEKGIVHRDLKPDNLFLTKRDDGTPRLKILDFGIAKVVKENLTGPQATTKTFGTPYYMAREQITGESALIGPRSDLYALAQIVYTLLVGTPYFQDEAKSSEGNILAVLMAVGNGLKEPATARAIRRNVELPPAFDAWFAKATALMPRDRFASAIEMIDALREVLVAPVRIIPGPPPSQPSARAASSAKLEDSFSSRERGSVPLGAVAPLDASHPEAFHQTGGPQSITTVVPRDESKKRSALYAALAGVAIVGALGGGVWRMSARPGSADAGSSNAAMGNTANGNAAPSNAAGSNAAGSNAAGSNAAGSNAAGSEPASRAAAQSDGAQGAASASATSDAARPSVSATAASAAASGAATAMHAPQPGRPAHPSLTTSPVEPAPTAAPKSHAASKGPFEEQL